MKISTAFFAFLVICLFVPLLGFGQVNGEYRSKGTGGDWNNASTWQKYFGGWGNATDYPGENAGTEKVTIRRNALVIINVTPSNSIGSLLLADTSNLSFKDDANYSLNVIDFVQVNKGANFTIASSTGSNNSITLGGNLKNLGTMDLFNSATSYCDIIFNGSTDQDVQINPADLHDVTIATTSGAIVTFTSGSAPTINGDLSVTSGTLVNVTNAITLAANKNFSVSNGATFSLTGTSTMVTVSGTGTKTFGTTSTVDYAGNSQTVTAETYGNLVLSNNGLKTLPGATIIVKGDFSTSGNIVTSQATDPINVSGDVILGSLRAFKAGPVTHTVEGSWYYNTSGAFVANSSTIVFSGSTGTETIGGTQDNSFTNVTINGSAVSLGSNMIVTNTLTLTDKTITLNDKNLTLNKVNGLSGGSSSSYINTNGIGRFIRTIGGSGTYDFPLGSSAGYDPATMTWGGAPGATEISSNFNSTQLTNPSGLYSTIYGGVDPTLITTFLNNGYWDFTATGSPNAFDLTLVAEAVTNLGLNDSFHSIFQNTTTDPSGWADAGTSPIPTFISGTSIALQMSGVNSVGYFGIGRSDEYILPIVLVDFDGSNVGNANVLSWTTATELNNDYFTIERSLDGKNYEEIGTVNGAGQSSTLLDYEYTDAQPYLGTNYYRLKQTDYNGAFDYSNVISIKVNGNFEMGYPYPNPVVNNVSMNILSANSGITYLRIFDMTGREMYAEKIAVNEGMQTLAIDMTNFASGMYISEIEIDGVSYRNTILKQ